MAKHNCESCPIRQKYDKVPKSLVGRFWRWHVNFCPGWQGYMKSLDDEKEPFLKKNTTSKNSPMKLVGLIKVLYTKTLYLF